MTRKLYENASTTVARTQPLVVMPVTITVSMFWWMSRLARSVPKKPLGLVL